MAIRLIVVMSWVMIVMMWMPKSWFDGECSILCHDTGCPHAAESLEPLVGKSFYTIADSSTQAMIAGLNQGKGSSSDRFNFYQWANLIAFFIFVPGWAWLNARLHNIDRRWYYAMVGSVVTMLAIGEVTAFKEALTGKGWYYYCTDWCIRVGNLTGLTYGGVCFVIFVVGIPGVLIADSIWGLRKRYFNRAQEAI